MTARALLISACLLGPAGAAAANETPFARLKSAPEPAARAGACVELSSAPFRGPLAYAALNAAMRGDLSDRVRLAAAVAALTYAGGRTLADVDSFLKAEPGPGVRRELLIALSTEPAHRANPDATRIIAASLDDDPSVEVRLAAAEALGARGDPLGTGAARRASQADADPGVREAARRSLLILSTPPKPKPKPRTPTPKLDATMGKDPCPFPWGWCACAGVVTLKPRCLTREECRGVQSDMALHGLSCKWDGRSDD